MRFAPYFIGLGLALLAPFACSSTVATTTTIVRPELVAVDPADFMGSVHCAAESADDEVARDPNTARTYVATLFDVTPGADGGIPIPGTPLASSPPTSCQKPITFTYVTAGRRYIAQVDAYREAPASLTPLSVGSRLMSANDARVVPRWTATCGGYPLSPAVDGGALDGGEAGAAPTDTAAQPPGVISYAAVTQTPHDCGMGLRDPNAE